MNRIINWFHVSFEHLYACARVFFLGLYPDKSKKALAYRAKPVTYLLSWSWVGRKMITNLTVTPARVRWQQNMVYSFCHREEGTISCRVVYIFSRVDFIIDIVDEAERWWILSVRVVRSMLFHSLTALGPIGSIRLNWGWTVLLVAQLLFDEKLNEIRNQMTEWKWVWAMIVWTWMQQAASVVYRVKLWQGDRNWIHFDSGNLYCNGLLLVKMTKYIKWLNRIKFVAVMYFEFGLLIYQLVYIISRVVTLL